MREVTLRQALSKQALNFWYRKSYVAYCLLPFSWIFQLICKIRHIWYQIKGQTHFGVPIIIVGNISLGGTGKTPLVGWIAENLTRLGFHPSIVLRGYGGSLKPSQTRLVEATSKASVVGDEPLLLARKFACPVMIGADRCKAIKHLLQQFPTVDVVICDDGLQHYALYRDIEIAVVDGSRRFGNGFLLPAGPLRESLNRLKKVDFIVANGKAFSHEWEMSVSLSTVHNVRDPEQTKSLGDFEGRTVHAIAGIGYPDKFFNMLRDKGITVIEHPFEDHHYFSEKDLYFGDDLPVFMTEKDAVKCQGIAVKNAWYVSLKITLPDAFSHQLLQRLKNGQKIARNISVPNLQTATQIQKREKGAHL